MKTAWEQRIAVAELEAFGLSVRTINMLEDCLDVIWLDELRSYDPVDLQAAVPNLGEKTLAEINEAVAAFEKAAPSRETVQRI